jgi:hypothetical protein
VCIIPYFDDNKNNNKPDNIHTFTTHNNIHHNLHHHRHPTPNNNHYSAKPTLDNRTTNMEQNPQKTQKTKIHPPHATLKEITTTKTHRQIDRKK